MSFHQTRGVEQGPVNGPPHLSLEYTSNDVAELLIYPLLFVKRAEIGCYNNRIALSVKFQSDWKSLNPNLAASRLHEVLR